MSWVSMQEDIVKQLENNLAQIRNAPDAKVLAKRCEIIMVEIKARMAALGPGNERIAYNYVELAREHKQLRGDFNRVSDRNLELREQKRELEDKLKLLKGNMVRLVQRKTKKALDEVEIRVKTATTELTGEVKRLRSRMEKLRDSLKRSERENTLLMAVKTSEFLKNIQLCNVCRDGIRRAQKKHP